MDAKQVISFEASTIKCACMRSPTRASGQRYGFYNMQNSAFKSEELMPKLVPRKVVKADIAIRVAAASSRQVFPVVCTTLVS